MLDGINEKKRKERKDRVMEKLRSTAGDMPPLTRERWSQFVEQMVQQCRSMSEQDIVQLAQILATLELSNSQYGLLRRLSLLGVDQVDDLDSLLEKWTSETAKVVLSKVEERVVLVDQLKRKMYNVRTHEVHELQPLIESSLWMFGPDFESVEFTSNEGMSSVIRLLAEGKANAGKRKKSTPAGSRLRPDFVILPDSSIGFYGRPGFASDGSTAELERIVIVELKRPGIPIGKEQKDQVLEYLVELRRKGYLSNTKFVDGFILGESLDPDYGKPSTDDMGATVRLYPMRYDTLVSQAETRMMGLYKKIKSAPFLASGMKDFLEPDSGPGQLLLRLNSGVAAIAGSALPSPPTAAPSPKNRRN